MEKIIGIQIIVLMIANVAGNPCLKSRSECQEIRMPLVSNELKAPLVAELDISAMNKQLKSYIKDDIQLTFSKDIKDMVKSEQNNLKTTMLEDYTSKMKTTKERYDNKISSIIRNLQAKEGKVQRKMSEVLKNLNGSEANFNEKMTDLLSGFEHKQESLKLAMLSEYLSKLQVSHDTNNQQIIDLANDLKSQFANLSRNIKDESVEVKSYLQTQTKELDEWKAKLMETIKGMHAPLKFKDCSYMTGKQLKSGVYTIYPNNVNGTKAYCDMTTEGGGWTSNVICLTVVMTMILLVAMIRILTVAMKRILTVDLIMMLTVVMTMILAVAMIRILTVAMIRILTVDMIRMLTVDLIMMLTVVMTMILAVAMIRILTVAMIRMLTVDMIRILTVGMLRMLTVDMIMILAVVMTMILVVAMIKILTVAMK
ncbi:ANGPT2 [Mytilus edulis]|uniref:ANGPT2 n=2 Tax=Mytilus edulis TaxID=6550 RepID=A0A8S3RV94_MYTED|nr:ANGPT2 [Mytilus edulis]